MVGLTSRTNSNDMAIVGKMVVICARYIFIYQYMIVVYCNIMIRYGGLIVIWYSYNIYIYIQYSLCGSYVYGKINL